MISDLASYKSCAMVLTKNREMFAVKLQYGQISTTRAIFGWGVLQCILIKLSKSLLEVQIRILKPLVPSRNKQKIM